MDNLTTEQIDKAKQWAEIVALGMADYKESRHSREAVQTILTTLEIAKGNVWQPIETAPKDGTEFLVLSPSGSNLGTKINVQNVFFCPERKKLFVMGGAHYSCFWPEPTHWTPLDLPTPPKESE